MQQLSIIVPVLGHQPSFEETLVSVLENRPRHAEVVVVCGREYRDDYDLEGEVEFVRVDGAHDWVDYANAAVRASQAGIVHWLWPGARVEEGWCDSAVDALEFDPEIASVAPLLIADNARWAGVVYACRGERLQQRCDRCRLTGQQRLQIDGPSRLAGWYRREQLSELGGWDRNIGPALADIDLGLRLRQLGYRCHFTVTGQVEFPSVIHDTPATRGWQHGVGAQRMLARYGSAYGWAKSLSGFPRVLLGELLQSPFGMAPLSTWAGRVAGMLTPRGTPAPWPPSAATPTDAHQAASQATTPAATGRSLHSTTPGDEGRVDEYMLDEDYLRFDTPHRDHSHRRKRRAAKRHQDSHYHELP